MMKKLQYALLISLSLFVANVNSASISIGPYALDTDAGATGVTFTGTVYENVTGAITDSEANTYIRGDSSDATASLAFDNISLSNQSGDDLALFFITASNTVSLGINGVTSGPLFSSQLFVNPDDPFIDNGEKYLVTDILLNNGTLATADLSVIFIDLEDFGINLNQSISNIDISLGLNTSLMTYAIGLNPVIPTAVPIPAPLFLLISGLTALGFFRKRK